MSKTATEIKATQEQQGIEVLQERYQKLNERRIAAERDLENARERLNELKTQARAKYNTDDIAELERKLEQMREENERLRSSYQQELDRIDDALHDVENRFEQAENGDEAQ